MKKIFLILLFASARLVLYAQNLGCTDQLATNFNAAATVNDGSCVYANASVSPVSSINLPAAMIETSGLVYWNNLLYTHNDNADLNLYSFDINNVNSYQTTALTGTSNIDWEEITQDSMYFYVGDFGNNANGNRTNLKVLRVNKASVLAGQPIIDTIWFSYANQTSFTATGGNNTDFDCEAFFATDDSLYLFTKQWVSGQSTIYAMAKTPGTQVAQPRGTLNTQGLITGCVFLKNQRIIALCGYSTTLQPFIYLLYDFTGNQFLGGNKRKISVPLNFHQIEGITSIDGITYYASNEKFTQSVITVNQKVHTFNLNTYLSTYLQSIITKNNITSLNNEFRVFPIPTDGIINIDSPYAASTAYKIIDSKGKTIKTGVFNQVGIKTIDIGELAKGYYMLELQHGNENIRKGLIKQ